MAKREHITSQSYIDWLKSLGCVFYAPLIQGDTRDYISGQDLVVSNGTVTWAISENAYQFYGPYSLNNFIASWKNLNLDIDINNFSSSWMCEVKGNNSNIVPICFGGRNFAQAISTGYINQWFKWATTIPASDGVTPRYQYWYTNGNYSSSFPSGYNRGTSPTVLGSAAKLSVECNPSGTYSSIINRTYYMRSVYIFNRQLSRDEIKEIQQIP